MIYIFTGDIRTGKTTTILTSCNERNDVGGFLSPDADGKRVILRVKDKLQIPFEVEGSEEEVIRVGRFNFLEAAFAESASWVLEDAASDDIQFVILDELGKLELQNQGYHKFMSKILELGWEKKHLILVIRDFLLDELVEHYNLQSAQIVNKVQITEVLS